MEDTFVFFVSPADCRRPKSTVPVYRYGSSGRGSGAPPPLYLVASLFFIPLSILNIRSANRFTSQVRLFEKSEFLYV